MIWNCCHIKCVSPWTPGSFKTFFCWQTKWKKQNLPLLFLSLRAGTNHFPAVINESCSASQRRLRHVCFLRLSRLFVRLSPLSIKCLDGSYKPLNLFPPLSSQLMREERPPTLMWCLFGMGSTCASLLQVCFDPGYLRPFDKRGPYFRLKQLKPLRWSGVQQFDLWPLDSKTLLPELWDNSLLL